MNIETVPDLIGDNPHDKEMLEAIAAKIKSLLQWEKDRAESGVPLPNSGVFLLNKISVLEDELINLKNGLIKTLQLPAQFIDVKLIKREDGSLVPSIDIDPPKPWILKVGQLMLRNSLRHAGDIPLKTVREMAQGYIRVAIEEAYRTMKARIDQRCKHIAERRAFIDEKEYEPTEARAK